MTYDEIVKKNEQEELKFYHDFWKHYIELEKLFLETEKYVAISEKNKKTYSIQYNIILQAVCAEIDIVLKRLCYEYDSSSHPENMLEYINMIKLFDSNLQNEEVELELYGLKYNPWKNISYINNKGEEVLKVPYWWDGYIKLKHRRLTFSKNNNVFNIIERNIQQANQSNVLGALAGLYTIEMRCLNKMRYRFIRLFQDNGYPHTSLEISNRFNDSMFQETIETTEWFG